jgi:selenocysteine lyase/cysteine desulfurase
VGVAGLKAGVEYILEEGIENIHSREMKLWEKARDGLEKIEGVTLYCAGSPENKIAVLSFNVEAWEAADVGTMLDVDYNIACRTGLQCAPLVHRQIGTEEIHGTVRVGIGPFNTEEHIDTLIQAVQEIASIKRGQAVG